MFELRNRGKLDPNTQTEFEHLYSRLSGLLSQAFDVDGNLIVADPNLAVIPVGGIVPYGGTTAPSGFLLCDGTAVSRTTYKALYDVIGTAYGVGDGSTTFNPPDLRQKFPLGKAASGTGNTLGATGGAIDHTHSGGSHTHTFATTTALDGDHAHTVAAHTHTIAHTHTASGTVDPTTVDQTVTVDTGSGVDVTLDIHTHTYSATTGGSSNANTGSASPATSADGDHTHAVSGTSDAASGTTGTNNPPYAVVNFVIYAGI
jgi:microcystin-dependent protein